MNRREHSHRIVCTMQVTFSRNVIRQSLVWNHLIPGGKRGSAGLCRPRFSFFSIQFSKNRHRRRDVVGRFAFGFGPNRVSLTRLSGISFHKGELSGRQRRAALVGEAYIVGGPSNCQHRFRTFLNFLRQFFESLLDVA